jgi:putative N6-adenine-specific DNA methylase
MDFTLFAVCAPGLEKVTAREIQNLTPLPDPPPSPGLVAQERGEGWRPREAGLSRVGGEVGGVEFRGDLRVLYRANLQLRTASRVLVRLGGFQANAFAELRRKAGQLEWEKFTAPGQPIALRVTCHKSRLYHSDAVAERVAGAIEDRLGYPIHRTHSLDDASLDASNDADEVHDSQLIVVRLVHDRCTISIDSSGALLHQRGYRLASGKAPLRETLAAGVLLASGWDRQSPLLDPFCGAGTIAIEAALLARQIAPGRARHFAFMDWPNYRAALWKDILAEAQADEREACPPILASDRDAGAVQAARANAERAGVAANIEFTRRAVSAIEPPAETGWVITNPPYGVRVRENRDLRNLYARFSQVLRAKCPGWQAGILIADAPLQASLNLPFDEGRSVWLMNGGLRVKLARARIPLARGPNTHAKSKMP